MKTIENSPFELDAKTRVALANRLISPEQAQSMLVQDNETKELKLTTHVRLFDIDREESRIEYEETMDKCTNDLKYHLLYRETFFTRDGGYRIAIEWVEEL